MSPQVQLCWEGGVSGVSGQDGRDQISSVNDLDQNFLFLKSYDFIAT